MRGQPVNVRLSESVALLVAEEAERTGRSRGQVIEELADEAARARLFPGIAVRGPQPRRVGAQLEASGHDVRALDQEPAFAGLPDDEVLRLAFGTSGSP